MLLYMDDLMPPSRPPRLTRSRAVPEFLSDDDLLYPRQVEPEPRELSESDIQQRHESRLREAHDINERIHAINNARRHRTSEHISSIRENIPEIFTSKFKDITNIERVYTPFSEITFECRSIYERIGKFKVTYNIRESGDIITFTLLSHPHININIYDLSNESTFDERVMRWIDSVAETIGRNNIIHIYYYLLLVIWVLGNSMVQANNKDADRDDIYLENLNIYYDNLLEKYNTLYEQVFRSTGAAGSGTASVTGSGTVGDSMYDKKYLKYKNKYLRLKKKYNKI
jgi:hypothetical protein